jgi:hypothetical protein
MTTENLFLLVTLLLSDLTYLRKSLRKEPRRLSSLPAHLACIGIGVEAAESLGWRLP